MYNWRYKVLGDLPHVQQRAEYQRANAGFCFDYQVVNVEDFNGVGESEPSPYFFQVSRDGAETGADGSSGLLGLTVLRRFWKTGETSVFPLL